MIRILSGVGYGRQYLAEMPRLVTDRLWCWTHPGLRLLAQLSHQNGYATAYREMTRKDLTHLMRRARMVCHVEKTTDPSCALAGRRPGTAGDRHRGAPAQPGRCARGGAVAGGRGRPG